LITPLATFVDIQNAGPSSMSIREEPSFWYFHNFDVSSDSYQFDLVMFCQFHQGLMAFPAEFGIYLQTVMGLDSCLTVRKKVYVSTFVTFSWILHYTSLNGIYITLEYCDVELNTEAVPPSQAPSVHPQLHCLDWFWTCLYTRPGPVFIWVEPFLLYTLARELD
jgi:hypothetical protein